ncbi:MAG TPA: hypothetical protein VGT03_06995 [Candidatus Acidoferrales bacterium]|nr:hypothetical protein [Candidatus Acidoferrales bacterium]
MNFHSSRWLRLIKPNSTLRGALVLAGLALLLFHFVPPTDAQNSSGNKPSATMRQVNISADARDVVLGDLPQVTAKNPAPRPDISNLRLPRNAAQFRALQQQVSQRIGQIPEGFTTMEPPKSPLDLTAQTSGILPDTIFPPSNAYIPPTTVSASGGCYNFDPQGVAIAANPQYLVQMVANCITVIDPATGGVYPGFPKFLNAFWFVSPSDFVLYPRAIYDSASNHFILAADDFSTNTLLLATSVTSNPTGTWHLYYLGDVFGDLMEDLTLGQSLQESGDKLGAIYLGHDGLNSSTFALDTDEIYVIGKTKTYAGHLNFPIFWFNFNDGAGHEFNLIQPANVVNPHDRPRAEILVNTLDFNFGGGDCVAGCNGLVLWSLTDQIPSTGRTPAAGVAGISTTNTYSLAGAAQQPSGSTCGTNVFFGGDPGIYGQVDYSSGLLYAAINSFNPVNSGSEVISWQIAPQLDDNRGEVIGGTIKSEAVLAFSGTASAFDPAMIPDSEGNYTMVYNYSSSTTPPTTAYLSNRATQTPNTLSDSGFLVNPPITPAPYCPSTSGGFPFFGFNAAGASTGVFPNSQWFSGGFSDATGNWGTVIGKTGYTNPAQP